MTKKEIKIDINKKMIGKKVWVVNGEWWMGEVVAVVDDNTLTIKKENVLVDVDIFDIRSV